MSGQQQQGRSAPGARTFRVATIATSLRQLGHSATRKTMKIETQASPARRHFRTSRHGHSVTPETTKTGKGILGTAHRTAGYSGYYQLRSACDRCPTATPHRGAGGTEIPRRHIAHSHDIDWISSVQHIQGMAALLAADRRSLSLVDCVSFDAMRRRGLRQVFAFDKHFEGQGFDSKFEFQTTLPERKLHGRGSARLQLHGRRPARRRGPL